MPRLSELLETYPPPTPKPPPTRDEELFEFWRNYHCPNNHEICFGVSALYRARERGCYWVVPAVDEHFGCLTPDELRVETEKHTETCPCWQHKVLREYRRRLTRRST